MKYIEFHGKRIGSLYGFTLIELISVMAIVSVVLAMVVPSVISISGGRDISEAVNTVQVAAATARQQAMSKATMVALLLSNTSPQQMILLQAGISGSNNTPTWTPTSNWVQLPLDVQASTSNFLSGVSQIPSFPTTVALGGQNIGISSFSYIIFYADGSVLSPTVQAGSAINLQRSHRPSTMTNPDYTVMIQGASGRASVYAY